MKINSGKHRVLESAVIGLVVLLLLSSLSGTILAKPDLTDELVNDFPTNPMGTRQYANNNTISVNGYVFNITDGEPMLPANLIAPDPENGTIGAYIIHFDGPIYQEEVDAVRNLGISIVNSVPYHAYKVHMTPEQAIEAENLTFVDWVGLYHPAYKIYYGLESLEVSVTLIGQEIPESALEQVRSEFESIEVEFASNGSAFNTTRYTFDGTLPSYAALNDTAANPYVHYITFIPEGSSMNGDNDDNEFNQYLLISVVTIVLVVSLVILYRKKQERME